MTKFPVVQIEGCAAHENTYSHNGKVWTVTNLIARAVDLEPFDLPLAAIYLGTEVWTPEGSPFGMAHHMRRALDVETSHPVILSEEGFIMDGWRRLLRALIDGKATIKAVRFNKTPPHDYGGGEPGRYRPLPQQLAVRQGRSARHARQPR